MSNSLSESERQLYRQVDQPPQSTTPSSNGSSSLSILAFILCAAVTLWFYLSGRHTLADYRERSYRLEMRRRHGIPDSDTRPFDVAYKDVGKKKALEEAKRVQLEEAQRQTTSRSNIQPDLFQEKENIWPNAFDTTPRPLKRPQFENSFSTPPLRTQFATNSTLGSRSEPRISDRTPFRDQTLTQVTDAPTPPGGLPLPDPYPPTLHPGHSLDSPHRSRKGMKRSASNTNDELMAPVRKKQVKHNGRDTDQSSLNSSTRSTDADIEDADMVSQSDEEPSEPDGNVSEHSQRGVKRHRDSETNTEIGGPTGKPELQKRRLDSRRPASLVLRGKKRDRSDQGSMIGDNDLRRSRKRERLYDTSANVEMLEDIREADSMDEDEDRPPESHLSTPTDNLTDELPFSTDPLCQGRRMGEEWTINRQRFKVGYDGRRLRHALVKRVRRKYNMPEDSIHPDAIQQIQVAIEVWLTDEEFREARDRQELAWQDGSLLSGLPPLSNSPHTPTYETPWSRSPGMSPLKRDFNRTIIPNPLLESAKVPTGRRLGYSIASSTPTRPSHLANMRAHSGMDKEENEAAALARFKEIREAKLAAAAATAEAKRAEDEKAKEKAVQEASAKATMADPITTPIAAFTPSATPAPGASAKSAPMFAPFKGPSTNATPEANQSAPATTAPSMPTRPPVPSFNFSAPPPPVSLNKAGSKNADDMSSIAQDGKPSLSFSAKPSTPSFNFSSTPSGPKGKEATTEEAKTARETSKPSFPFALAGSTFNSTSPSTVLPKTEDSAAQAQVENSPSKFGAKPTVGGFNFSSAPSVPQAANVTKESSTLSGDQQAKVPSTKSSSAFSSTQSSTPSQRSAFEAGAGMSADTGTKSSTFPFTKPSAPSLFGKSPFDVQSKTEGNASSLPPKDSEPRKAAGFDFTASSVQGQFKSAFGTSAFPTPSSVPALSTTSKPTTPIFGSSSTSAFNFGTSGPQKSDERPSSTNSNQPQPDTNTLQAKDGPAFSRPVKGLPNARGSSAGPPGEKPSFSFNFGQSSAAPTPPPASQDSTTAPAFSFGSTKEKDHGPKASTSVPSNPFNFGG